ncbi:MAG: hypothetical protein V3V08_18110 [Nannocystaceae bacterium]
MEKLRLDLKSEGHLVQFVIVNKYDAVDTQDKLYERCSIPIFQDLSVPAEANVWSLHEGKKDDMYVYDREGNLAAYLPKAGPESINLSTEDGYAFVRGSILSVLNP